MHIVKIVVFLQNAWSPLYAGGTWPRLSWLRALETSRSGQRLKVMIDDLDVCENTTPIVGASSDSVVKPDLAHIKGILAARRPYTVITCGKQAENAVSGVWTGSLIAVPHPAHRLLTNELYKEARALIADNFVGRLALRQDKGAVRRELLD